MELDCCSTGQASNWVRTIRMSSRCLLISRAVGRTTAKWLSANIQLTINSIELLAMQITTSAILARCPLWLSTSCRIRAHLETSQLQAQGVATWQLSKEASARIVATQLPWMSVCAIRTQMDWSTKEGKSRALEPVAIFFLESKPTRMLLKLQSEIKSANQLSLTASTPSLSCTSSRSRACNKMRRQTMSQHPRRTKITTFCY